MRDDTLWQLEGTLKQVLYSPKGDYEGVLLDVDGVTAQFVADGRWSDAIGALRVGRKLTLTGFVRPPSDKGPAAHDVYELHEIVGAASEPEVHAGKVVRFNYAKHGEPNGVILDDGTFLHTKPAGLRELGWKVGQKVGARGKSRRLAGGGRVVEVESGEAG